MQSQNDVTKDKVFERCLMEILGDIASIHNNLVKKNEFMAGYELAILQDKILDMIAKIYEDAKEQKPSSKKFQKALKSVKRICEKQSFDYPSDPFNFLHAPYINGHC
jgi:hypothetical protein